MSDNTDQVEVKISAAAQQALEQAFEEAREKMSFAGTFVPFTVIAVDGGLELDEHEGDGDVDAIYMSVCTLLASDMPSAYAFCYDGFIETDNGEEDAIIVEVADRGSVASEVLALLYTVEDEKISFIDGYSYAGHKPQLYPAGTKPIVSGLDELDADIEDTDTDTETSIEE